MWLAANGGHFDIVQLLVHAGADVDAADNRKVTPLMSAFRKVKYLFLSFESLRTMNTFKTFHCILCIKYVYN